MIDLYISVRATAIALFVLFFGINAVSGSNMAFAQASEAESPSSSKTSQSEAASPQEPSDGDTSFRRPGQTGLALPRFVRGVRYPIDWVYHRPGLPVEIIDEFDTWRRIRDWEGTVGWVHQSMLEGKRTALVNGGQRLLRKEPGDDAPGIAFMEPGVLGKLISCQSDWCEVSIQGYRGWLRRSDFYGIYPQENL
jgi:SH3-like domain-containing protein